jgi:hypothetical protein
VVYRPTTRLRDEPLADQLAPFSDIAAVRRRQVVGGRVLVDVAADAALVVDLRYRRTSNASTSGSIRIYSCSRGRCLGYASPARRVQPTVTAFG